ncbi:MAG: relaxase, partial [Pseudomonadota bacterium]
MILVGNQRGGARDLALHLMKDENESVVVHDLRGFVGNDLMSAFRESQAISRATRCRQHLYSLSLNPPPDAIVDPEAFEAAIDRAEARLGLTGQPRAIVFHEKQGLDGEIRRHAHAVWCRINPDSMTAVHLPHTKRKLQE